MATELTYRHVMPVQIRFSDVDQYGHMNNSSYFSIYDLAKTSYMRDVFGDKEWNTLGIWLRYFSRMSCISKLQSFIWDIKVLLCCSVPSTRRVVY